MCSQRCCFFFFLIVHLLLIALTTLSAASSDKCVYNVYVETGSMIKAGTDSNISITLSDSHVKSLWIPNLKEWGLMGRKHDYFERGNLDIFTGLGPCLGAPICKLNITSDGLGAHHGWLCDYVEVTLTGPHMGCSQSIFAVDQWLASDVAPYKLWAVLDGCDFLPPFKNGPFAVGNKPVGSATY